LISRPSPWLFMIPSCSLVRTKPLSTSCTINSLSETALPVQRKVLTHIGACSIHNLLPLVIVLWESAADFHSSHDRGFQVWVLYGWFE
jgi:hypothetical protein